MRYCPSCGNENTAAATLCDHCGRTLHDPPALVPSDAPATDATTTATDPARAPSEVLETPPLIDAPEASHTLQGFAPHAQSIAEVALPAAPPMDDTPASAPTASGDSAPPPEAIAAGDDPSVAVETLPAMPRGEVRGWWSTVGYALGVVLTGARLQAVVRRLDQEVRQAQRQLDTAYAELGQAARAAGRAVHGGETAVAALDRLDPPRAQLEQQFARLRVEQQVAQQRFADAERTIGDRRDRAEARAREVMQTLSLRKGERVALEARVVAQRRALRLLARERDGLRVRAARADAGEASKDLERSAAEKAVAIGDATRAQSETQAALQRLAGPLRELGQALRQERDHSRRAARDLAAARRELSAAARGIEQREQRCTAELLQLDREATQQLAALGRLVVAGEERADETFLAQVARVERQRADWSRLQRQRSLAQHRQRDYDPAALRRGLAMVGTLLLLALAGLLTLLALRSAS
ncbi:MAG: hypothetical protein IPG96_13680 [Proteobacteria bacterium]|nr:hypothetical protein [Pseudomonadota bacterium]